MFVYIGLCGQDVQSILNRHLFMWGSAVSTLGASTDSLKVGADLELDQRKRQELLRADSILMHMLAFWPRATGAGVSRNSQQDCPPLRPF